MARKIERGIAQNADVYVSADVMRSMKMSLRMFDRLVVDKVHRVATAQSEAWNSQDARATGRRP